MKHFVIISGVLATALSTFGAESNAVTNQATSSFNVEINGARISLSELERKHPTALFQARNSFYEAERKVLDQLLDQYLLEQQAKKENVTVAELFDRHVAKAIAKDPPEETLRVYYEGVDTTESYESVRAKIIEAIRSRRMQKAKTEYLQALRKEYKAVIRMDPPRADISMKDTPVRGAADARVTVVEFADYECPYCQQFQPVLDKLETEYKGRVAFAYKDAEASHCAGAQGKYWEYHDELVSKKQLDLEGLKTAARTLKLDTKAFEKCLASGEQAAMVQAQANEAQSLGVQGTPTLFINGRYFSGALSYEKIREIIDEELANTVGGAQQTAKR